MQTKEAGTNGQAAQEAKQLPPLEEERFIRKEEVLEMTGIKAISSLYYMMKHNGFPRPVKLTPRMAVWPLREVQGWMAAMVKECRDNPANS